MKVVLIGRTNVGKSTLFNRLTETKKAIVSEIAGTTRDLNSGTVEWGKDTFELVDTGGIDLSNPGSIDQEVIKFAWREIYTADLVLFVVDTKDGVLPNDQVIAQKLHEHNIDFWVVANKADSPKLRDIANEFYILSTEVIPLSAANGSGTADLLDKIVSVQKKSSKKKTVSDIKENPVKIALAGIPNVGKSSLLNALLKREEVIVSDIPHTTREARDLDLEYKGHNLKLIDTAGVRKMRKMREFLKRESAKRSMDAYKNTDWVIFVVDCSQKNWGEQERYILNELMLAGKNIIVAVNKWDLLNGEYRFKDFKERWYMHFGHYPWIPFIPVSALTGWHVDKLLDKIIELDENRHRDLPQSALDRLLKAAIKRRRPQKKKGPEAPYIHAIKQIDTAPPTFEVVIDYKDTLAESYVKFLIKSLRRKFNFEATPIRMYIRSIRS